MNKILFSAALLATLLPMSAQADYPEALWAGRMTGVAGGDILQNMIVNTDGDLVALSYLGSTSGVYTMSWMGETVDGISFDPNYNGTSTNKNAVITKHNPETGEIIWTAYSYSGDWINGQGAVRQTSDGGYVYASKVRIETTGTVTDSAQLPAFVGSDGTMVTLKADSWAYNGSRFYNMAIVKLSPEGVIEWTRTAQVNANPMPDATSSSLQNLTPDGISITDVAVDESGYIYVSGRVSTAITFDSNTTLTATSNQGWNGDSQTSVGNMYIAKYDSNGNFVSYFSPSQVVTVQNIISLDYKDGNILLCGYITNSSEEVEFDFGGISIQVGTLQSLVMAQLDTDLKVEWASSLVGQGYNGSQIVQNGRANYIGDEAYVALQWTGGFDINGTLISNSASQREGLILCFDADNGAVKAGATSRETFGESTNIVGYHNVMQSPVSEDSVYVCGSWLLANKGLLLRSYSKGDLQTNGLTQFTLTSAGVNATGYAVENDGVIFSYFRPNKEASVMGSDEIVSFATNGYTIVMAAHRFADATSTVTDSSVWDGVAPDADAEYAFSGGDGSEGNPYIIATPADLAQLAANVNGGTTYADVYFAQSADITLNNSTTTNEWPSIGTTAANSFQGTYDGQGYSISGLRSTVRQNYSGLFGFAKNATFLNMAVVDAYANFELDNMVAYGVIAGDAMGCTIINCYTTGDMTMKLIATNKSGYLGGIVGMGTASSGVGNTILNCYSYANLTYEAADECTPLMQYVAGISAQVNGTITNCFYGGTIVFGIETGAKYFASAIAANTNGTPEVTETYYVLGTGSSDGIYGYNTSDSDSATDVSSLTLNEISDQLTTGAQSLADNGYVNVAKAWTNDGVEVYFGDVISNSSSIISVEATVSDVLDINAPRYNVMGQRVSNSYRGIVIQNGKKLYVK